MLDHLADSLAADPVFLGDLSYRGALFQDQPPDVGPLGGIAVHVVAFLQGRQALPPNSILEPRRMPSRISGGQYRISVEPTSSVRCARPSKPPPHCGGGRARRMLAPDVLGYGSSRSTAPAAGPRT